MLNSKCDENVKRGVAYFDLAALMRSLNIDCIPLQMKTLSREQLVQFVLEELPLGHLNIDSLDGANGTLDISADEETIRHLQLHSEPLPAKRLIDAVIAIGTESVDEWGRILLVVNTCVLKLEDFHASFLLCMALLQRGGDLPQFLTDAVVEACQILLGSLDRNASEGEFLHKTLLANLLLFKPDFVKFSSSDCNCILPVAVVDDELISKAHQCLLKLVGVLLIDIGDSRILLEPVAPANEVIEASAASSTLSDIYGYLHLVSDRGKVDSMLEKLVSDLQRKMSSAAKLNEDLSPSISPNETVVGHLLNMGFPRNAALKAAMSTRATEEAVAWAIEHSSDNDFDEPLTITVNKALLPETFGLSMRISNLQHCLDIVQMLHSNIGGVLLPPRSRINESGDGSTHFDSRPEKISISNSSETGALQSTSELPRTAPSNLNSMNLMDCGNGHPDTPIKESSLDSVLSRTSQASKLRALIDIAEDFTGLFSARGVSASAFTDQLIQDGNVSGSMLEELILALAAHSDFAAFSLLRKIFDATPSQVLQAALSMIPSVATAEYPQDLVFDTTVESLEELVEWKLGMYRLMKLFQDHRNDEDIKANLEVLYPVLAKQPSRYDNKVSYYKST